MALNKIRMKILAAVLNGAGLPQKFKFDMEEFYHKPTQFEPLELNTCGTSGCIAGLTVHLFGDRSSMDIEMDAKRLLGLTPHESDHLFFGVLPSGKEIKMEAIRKKHAAAICAHAAQTGKIDWRKAGKLPLKKDGD